MAILAKDILKLEQAMQAGGASHYLRDRYQAGAEHVGIYRIFMIWPDKLKEVQELDGEWRENAVTFLEVNPRYFRSGYDKAQLLRYLKRADLSQKHKYRLKTVLLDVVGRPSGVEFRQYCQLAARLVSKDLTVALSKLVTSEDEGIRRRASWMMAHADDA
jgi:hypothetical protein